MFLSIPNDLEKVKIHQKNKNSLKQFLIDLFSNDSVLMSIMKNNDRSINKKVKEGITENLKLETINDSIVDKILQAMNKQDDKDLNIIESVNNDQMEDYIEILTSIICN